MTLSVIPEQLEASFKEVESKEHSYIGSGTVRRRLLLDSCLDIFTEVRFPGREWALLVRGDKWTENRDIVLTAGLTCRTRNGSFEVVAEPGTDRLLVCTLLADLVKQ